VNICVDEKVHITVSVRYDELGSIEWKDRCYGECKQPTIELKKSIEEEVQKYLIKIQGE